MCWIEQKRRAGEQKKVNTKNRAAKAKMRPGPLRGQKTAKGENMGAVGG